MTSDDTIVAISSAVGTAARMIVRASGPGVSSIYKRIPGSDSFSGGAASRVLLNVVGMSVPAWVYCFASPVSATGQDVVEFHLPGNPLLARMLLDEIVRAGARQAEAGEFSARAYFNGKIDLTKAEGISATIAAHGERELRAARQLMAGELARRLRPVLDSLADTLALVEAGIDFTDQGISFLSADHVASRINESRDALASLLRESSRLERLSHEPAIVLTGRPNAGKSTLLNALVGHDRAIVSPVAGTTRDILWAHAELRRGRVKLIDVAGLDESSLDDPIERSMRGQAHRAIEEADLVLLVKDCMDQTAPMHPPREPNLHVIAKIDLDPGLDSDVGNRDDRIRVSAKSGAGLETLRNRLDRLAFGEGSGDASLTLNARHVALIREAQESLDRAAHLLPDGGLELLAIELREALDALGSVLGNVTPDDVLGRVFSRFCIGK